MRMNCWSWKRNAKQRKPSSMATWLWVTLSTPTSRHRCEQATSQTKPSSISSVLGKIRRALRICGLENSTSNHTTVLKRMTSSSLTSVKGTGVKKHRCTIIWLCRSVSKVSRTTASLGTSDKWTKTN
jgi:hypothetical protein